MALRKDKHRLKSLAYSHTVGVGTGSEVALTFASDTVVVALALAFAHMDLAHTEPVRTILEALLDAAAEDAVEWAKAPSAVALAGPGDKVAAHKAFLSLSDRMVALLASSRKGVVHRLPYYDVGYWRNKMSAVEVVRLGL